MIIYFEKGKKVKEREPDSITKIKDKLQLR